MLITHDVALGGLQQVIVNICKTIDRSRFVPSVLCLRTMGDYAANIQQLGIPVHLLQQKKHGIDYCAFLKVAKLLKQERIDVIHTHNTQPFIDGTIGGILAGVKTIIHTDHAREFPDKRRYMFAEWFLSYFVHKVVAVSEHTARNLMSYEKISPKKITIIPNGIDGSAYSIALDKQKKCAELGITKKGPIIGIGVRLCEQKGITYLLRAMPELIKSFPECTLVIAGRGALEDTLKREASELGIQAYVKFLGMRLDIPELLQLFDVYVLPSNWEGIPMALLEAMAAGCPIVATDVGGVSAVITSEETGLLVKPKEPQEISRAIGRLLSDRQLSKKITQRAFETFKERFEARIMTRNYEKLYLWGKGGKD